ncbi:hypothetical protein GCM10027610_041930 [Dactylosporangium cerinum]
MTCPSAERSCRVTSAAGSRPSAMPGRTRYESHVPTPADSGWKPNAGNICSPTEKTVTSTRPNQKPGMAIEIEANQLMTRSTMPPERSVATSARAVPSTMAKIIATSTSDIVVAIRRVSRSVTLWSERKDVPRLPCRTLPIHLM